MSNLHTEGLPLAVARSRRRMSIAESLARPAETHPIPCRAAPSNARGDSEILLSTLEAHFLRYAALARGLPLVLSLWSLATYVFGTFDAFPYLAITSPTKGCGKTRVAELIELVCANPLRTVGISVAALFRTIEKNKPTLIIDEAESLREKGERPVALREVLNAGYRRGQKVLRCFAERGKDYEPREFETYCPKVIVLIGSLPDTLADRCIPVPMKRRRGERLERFRFGRVKAEAQALRGSAKEWAGTVQGAVEEWYQRNDLSFLEDREAELWLPLFAVCAVAAPGRMPELERVARQLSGNKTGAEPGDDGIHLLADCRSVFDSTGADRLTTEELLSKLNSMGESPWPGWSNGMGLDDRWLSKLLRPFGIHSGDIRLEEKVRKGYKRADFEDAWGRYLPPVSATSATGLENQRDSAQSASATGGPVADTKTGQSPMFMRVVAV